VLSGIEIKFQYVVFVKGRYHNISVHSQVTIALFLGSCYAFQNKNIVGMCCNVQQQVFVSAKPFQTGY